MPTGTAKGIKAEKQPSICFPTLAEVTAGPVVNIPAVGVQIIEPPMLPGAGTTVTVFVTLQVQLPWAGHCKGMTLAILEAPKEILQPTALRAFSVPENEKNK